MPHCSEEDEERSKETRDIVMGDGAVFEGGRGVTASVDDGAKTSVRRSFNIM